MELRHYARGRIFHVTFVIPGRCHVWLGFRSYEQDEVFLARKNLTCSPWYYSDSDEFRLATMLEF